jgi:hypothetical protein
MTTDESKMSYKSMTSYDSSTASGLLDIRITQTVIEFAQALLKRYNLEYAECMEQGRQLDIDFGIDDDDALTNNPEYSEEVHSNMGEGNGILKCMMILDELVKAEIQDREQYTLESKK